MSFNILRTDVFTKHLKQLAKKYPSIKNDFSSFLISLENDPLQGISLGKNCYKVRLKITSKNIGKSGGGRIITYVRVEQKRIILLDVYDKADRTTISDKELSILLKHID